MNEQVVKADDDLRQEQIAVQLIREFHNVFDAEVQTTCCLALVVASLPLP